MRRLAATLVLFLAACGATPRGDAGGGDEVPPPVAKPRRPGKGLVETVEGVRVVHLSGTPEEMGEQMGTLLGEDLRYLLDANLKKTPYVAKDPKAAVEKARR